MTSGECFPEPWRVGLLGTRVSNPAGVCQTRTLRHRTPGQLAALAPPWPTGCTPKTLGAQDSGPDEQLS